MRQSSDENLVWDSAARLYGDGQPIWDPSDRWNTYKRAAIDAFAKEHVADRLTNSDRILDAGSGSRTYEWLPSHAISLDRFWLQVRERDNPVAGDLQRLPFASASMDAVVCVASVLNYVSAAEAISELGRVMRPGGFLLLHFETSSSLEHIGTGLWGRLVARLDTLNSGRNDTIWIYRPSYVRSLLNANGLSIVRTQGFHILSAGALRFGFSQQRSAALAVLDGWAKPLAFFADDFILLAEKRAAGAA